MNGDLKLHYYAATQVNKVRFVMVFSLLVGAGLLYLAYVAARYYEMDGGQGELAPVVIRLSVAAAIALLATTFPIAMWVYAACYVESIEADADGSSAIYHTLALFGTRAHSVHPDDIESTRSNKGVLKIGGTATGPIVPRVNAPWKSVRVKGRRLPFIIDGQGFYYRWKNDTEFELERASW
jgi:hypothetical protein